VLLDGDRHHNLLFSLHRYENCARAAAFSGAPGALAQTGPLIVGDV
jgi:hypothetical protein